MIFMQLKSRRDRVLLRLVVTAMFMAINILLSMSTFSIPVPGGHLYLNDIVISLSSILLGPVYAFVAGGVGAFLGDLFFYPKAMFVSLIVRGLQAVVISVISHYVLKKHPIVASGIGVTFGAIINVVGYTFLKPWFYSFVSGSYEAAFADAVIKLPWQILMAVGGAVIGMIICWPCGIHKLYDKMFERKY